MARPRGDVLRRQIEAVPRQHRVGRLQPLKLDGDGARAGVVRQRDAPVDGGRGVVVGDGVVGHFGGGVGWGCLYGVDRGRRLGALADVAVWLELCRGQTGYIRRIRWSARCQTVLVLLMP